MINKSSRLPWNNLYPLLFFSFIIIYFTPTKSHESIKFTKMTKTNDKDNDIAIPIEIQLNSYPSMLLLWAMELRSLALCDKLEEEELGIERIPRARRIRITNVNINNTVRIKVDDDDFRAGSRECLAFAIFCPEVENGQRDRKMQEIY